MIELYRQRIAHLSQMIHALTRQSKLISRLRLLTFLIAIGWTWYWWNQPLILAAGLAILLVFFLFLVSKSRTADHELNIQVHLLQINKVEEQTLQGQYQNKNTGAWYLSAYDPKINGMTKDLDIYGDGSLFQYINRTVSDQGCDRMAASFVHPYSKEQILLRQEAIQELTPMIDWRQRLMAIQLDKPIVHETLHTLQQWIADESFSSLSNTWKVIRIVLPCITIAMTIFYAAHDITGNDYLLYGLAVFVLLAFIAQMASRWFKPLQRIRHELETLLPCIQAIEHHAFKSDWINTHIAEIIRPAPASCRIAALNKILDRFDFRMNPIVFIPLNYFLLWDLQQVFALDMWRQKFKGNIKHWFDGLGEIEALSSYANLAFNHPDWTYPLLSPAWFTFETQALAHPLLLPPKVVANDFSLSDPNRMALITGSNMAGKSTFLRSVGTNIILAGAGAPVHARYFRFSPGQVLTSMRISDNLQEETSTFYAELKKIKIIVDAVQAEEKVIILIDEMLRGTNAEDRRIGSHGFIKQIIEHGAVGIIASHDTGLSTFKEQYPEVVQTYYFDSYLEQDEIKFDYTIKPGVCTSANASYLMKKMGIDI